MTQENQELTITLLLVSSELDQPHDFLISNETPSALPHPSGGRAFHELQ